MNPTSPTHRKLWRPLLIACAAIGSLLAVPTASAGAEEELPPSASVADSTPWSELEAIAARDGTVPVIVTLKANGRLRHQLTRDQGERQVREIRTVRAALDKDMGGKRLRNLNAMDDLPVLAFQADATDLARLKVSRHVAAVVLDESHTLPELLVGDQSTPISASGPVGTDVEATSAPDATTADGWTTQLTNWWDYYRIGVDKAVANGYTGTGQYVAVIDTGVDRFHPWLAGDVVAEACYATAFPGYGAGCPNGTAFQSGAGSAAPCLWSGCDHGTHVAHTAAGQYGVASGAKVIAIQVFHYEPAQGQSAAGPRVYDSDLTWAMKYVYDLRTTFRIAAVNMSLGGGGYTGYCDGTFTAASDAGKVGAWINALTNVGIGVVVSSGNDDYINAVGKPACFSNAVSVGNTTLTASGADAVFGYVAKAGSNSNATLDLLAPGTDICSAVPNSRSDCGYIGTSMAAPHVAGAFALLRQYRPAATVGQMVTALQRSGVAVTDSRNGIVRSRINVWNALGTIYSV
jgi:subtilisin family serine protease